MLHKPKGFVSQDSDAKTAAADDSKAKVDMKAAGAEVVALCRKARTDAKLWGKREKRAADKEAADKIKK